MKAGDLYRENPSRQGHLTDPHIWVLLTGEINGLIAWVNFSDGGGSEGPFTSCVFEGGEHDVFEKRSCVAYRRAVLVPGPMLRSAENNHLIVPLGSLTAEHLKRIVDGAFECKFIPKQVLEHIRLAHR